MPRLRVAVAGCGPKGGQHAGILASFEDVEIVAVCDPMPAARDALGDKHGVAQRYADVNDLLATESLDAVWAAPPPHLNAAVALPCLEHGVNTFLEKPPGMSADETISLRDAAASAGVQGMVGWNRRLHPMIVQAQELVRERGPVVQLVGEFHKSLTQFEQRGKYSDFFLDNMMWESINHSVDLVRAMARSEVAEVHSVVRRALHKYKDVFGALILFENGCLAHLIFNWTSDARLERYEIHGRDISAYLEGVNQAVVFCDGERRELPRPPTAGTEEEDRYFLDCIQENRLVEPPACNLAEAVKTMQLAEAILAGLRPAA
ncbi:MAG: hypothetical protein CL878_02815 [Dehalococcoidia bacterium]|nr:hypothetical protein [Dehalococcoidia bacterium]